MKESHGEDRPSHTDPVSCRMVKIVTFHFSCDNDPGILPFMPTIQQIIQEFYLRCLLLYSGPGSRRAGNCLARHRGHEAVYGLRLGGRWDRPELHRLLDQLRPGDVVIVWELDRLSRSLKDLLHIMERTAQAEAGFRSLTEAIDTTTP